MCRLDFFSQYAILRKSKEDKLLFGYSVSCGHFKDCGDDDVWTITVGCWEIGSKINRFCVTIFVDERAKIIKIQERVGKIKSFFVDGSTWLFGNDKKFTDESSKFQFVSNAQFNSSIAQSFQNEEMNKAFCHYHTLER